jgi:hypothetical protein
MVKNNNGGRRGWATPEQKAWLLERGHLFLNSQEAGPRALANFWPAVFEEWFAQWPEPATGTEDLSISIKARKSVRLHQNLCGTVAHLSVRTANQAVV